MTTPSNRRTTRSASCVCFVAGILNQYGLVAAQFIEHLQSIRGQRAAGFHQVDDRVGNSQRNHDFDGAGQLHDVRVDLVLGEIRLRDRGKARRDASPRQIGWLMRMPLSSGTHIASRQLPMPSGSRVSPRRRSRQSRSPPVIPMSMAPSAHSTGMSSVRKNVTSIGMSRTRANRLRS